MKQKEKTKALLNTIFDRREKWVEKKAPNHRYYHHQVINIGKNKKSKKGGPI